MMMIVYDGRKTSKEEKKEKETKLIKKGEMKCKYDKWAHRKGMGQSNIFTQMFGKMF